MQLSSQQKFNQALIQMAVLLYQVDRKVTLTEQDALDELVDKLEWSSPICVDAGTALETACFITGVDGERSEEEVEYLHLLTHKLLAKALTTV
jgi:tellurite resistance protein